MALIINGIEYLNSTEAAKYVGWSVKTFLGYAKDLKRHNFKGKGVAVFYRKSDLDQFLPRVEADTLEKRLADVARSVLRNTPTEELPPEWLELKRQIE